MGTKAKRDRTNTNTNTAQTVQETAPAAPAAPAAPVVQGKTGLRIEPNRPTANGVTKRSAGGKCDAVWVYCGAHLAAHGTKPTVAQVREWAAQNGYNTNNAQIEYYCWCKHAGVSKTQLAAAALAAQAAAK